MSLTPIQEIEELHLLLGIIHNVDVGLVVLDADLNIRIWNHFMWNHSGINPSTLSGKNLFREFPGLPEAWLRKKIDSVFLLNNRSFSTWQQRPYIMKFDSYKPITGSSSIMFQNMTIFPLISVNGRVEHVCLMLYDVTDAALDEKALQQANTELDRISRTDGLTQLLNRRAWEEEMHREYKRNSRSHSPSSLLMFDIDHFKKVNDTYGHQAGDEVIKRVADIVRESKRECDIAGRYGGEEYCIILLDTDSRGGLIYAERLRVKIAGTPVTYEDFCIDFTISIGVSEVNDDMKDAKVWLEQADQALYQSKENGRNLSTIYSKPGPKASDN